MAPFLPPSALQVLPPTPTSQRLSTALLPSSPTILSRSASLSFEFKNGEHGVFVDRITYRELQIQNDGSVIATIDQAPRFPNEVQGETDVRVHVWRGEKLMGSWDVGRF